MGLHVFSLETVHSSIWPSSKPLAADFHPLYLGRSRCRVHLQTPNKTSNQKGTYALQLYLSAQQNCFDARNLDKRL
uniref:Uncharacterized protein n=1 Tax=Rhizophora mucronata TaxID=61149 RepID=A0A2P2KGU1_RHIMU